MAREAWYIMNALDKDVSTQVHGKWFSFKPRQIKLFANKDIAEFMAMNRGEEGLVDIPEEIMELPAADPERVKVVEEKRFEGVQKRVRKLDMIKENLLTSLRYDVELKGIKADPLTFASKGELLAIRELKTLSGEVDRHQANVADEIRKELGLDVATSSSANIGANPTGHTSTPRPTKG